MTLHGCHDHAPYGAPQYHSRDKLQLAGWPYTFDPTCQFEPSATEPKCAGCRWARVEEKDKP